MSERSIVADRLSRAPFWLGILAGWLAIDVWGWQKTLFMALLAFVLDKAYDAIVLRLLFGSVHPPQEGRSD